MAKQSYSSFEEANAEALALFQKGEFSTAMGILEDIRPDYPDRRADIDYLRSCLAVRLGDQVLALQIFDDLLNEGIWFSETLFRGSPSYQPLQGNSAFEKLVAAHLTLRKNAEIIKNKDFNVLTPENEVDKPYPLILLLHGNGSNPSDEIKQWKSATDVGWLVAAPRAQAAYWAGGGAFWTDHEDAQRQIQGFLEFFQNTYSIDLERVILAGFSMGGDIAIAQSLKAEILHPLGFIAIGPGGPMVDMPETYQPLLNSADRTLRCVFMASTADDLIQIEKIYHLSEMFQETGLPTRFEEYADKGHVYPADFGTKLAAALHFIVGSS